ncbi:MAG: pseudouridine synthase [bacterium]
MRLNKFLARSGVASRRKCDRMIFDGRVKVNGEVVTEPWFDVDPDRDDVQVGANGIEPPEGHAYLLLHKPAGTITTMSDPHDRPTVVDLLGDAFQDRRVVPVGRLDADTTGALILTDDGELTHRLTHPSFGIRKVYSAALDRPIGERDLESLEQGVALEDGPVEPDGVRRESAVLVEVTLHEGRKHVMKRMFAALGYTVERLHRRRFAGLSADHLEQGQWRELNREEVNVLREGVGLDPLP